MYQKAELSRDKQSFFRILGKKRWRFGNDPLKAKIRAATLEALYAKMEAQGESWTDETLTIGRAIAKGLPEVALPTPPEMTQPDDAVFHLQRFSHLQDLIKITAADPNRLNQGKAVLKAQRKEAIQEAKRVIDINYPNFKYRLLHDCLDQYVQELKAEEQDLSGWKKIKRIQGEILKMLPNISIEDLNLETMEGQLKFWAKRPLTQKKTPMTKATAVNMIKQTRDLWRWLSKKRYWNAPINYREELGKVKIEKLPGDHQKLEENLFQVNTFTIEELTQLYKKGGKLTKAIILLGLNCGFGAAEMGTLRWVNIQGSHIHIYRSKSEVRGRWLLWQETIDALEKLPKRGEFVFMSKNGISMIAKTCSGNMSSRLPNYFRHLQRKANVKRLSLKFLRKTGANLIRQNSSGEAAGVYLCHKRPCLDKLSEVYSNRNFDEVDTALIKVREMLQPMFV